MPQTTTQTDFTTGGILQELRKRPHTYGYGAVSIWDRQRLNQLLLLEFIKKSMDNKAYQPISHLIRNTVNDVEISTTELANIVLGPPLLSFENSTLQNSRAMITLPLLDGAFVIRSSETKRLIGYSAVQASDGGEIKISSNFSTDMSNNQCTFTIKLQESGSLKLEFPYMSDGFKQKCNEYLSQWLKANTMEYQPAGVNLKPPGNTLELKEINLRTHQHPNNHQKGAVVAFIKSNYDKNDARSIPAKNEDFPWLIPEGSTCALLFSHKVLMRDLLKQKLENQLAIPNGLSLKPNDTQDFFKLVATGQGEYKIAKFYTEWLETSSSTSVDYELVGSGDEFNKDKESCGAQAIPFTYKHANESQSFTILVDGPQSKISYQWGEGNISSSPDSTNFPLKYWGNNQHTGFVNTTYYGNPSYETGTVKYSYKNATQLQLDSDKNYIIHFNTSTPTIQTWSNLPVLQGIDSGVWDEKINRPIKPYIENDIKSNLQPLKGLQLDTIKLLAETHLFSAKYGMHLESVHLPGDIALFGNIDPQHTKYYVEPSYLPLGPTQSYEFRLHPTASNPENADFTLEPNLGSCQVNGTKLTYTAPNQVKAITPVQLRVKYKNNGNEYESAALIPLLPSPIFLNRQVDIRKYSLTETEKKISYKLNTLMNWKGGSATSITWTSSDTQIINLSGSDKASREGTLPNDFPGGNQPITVATVTAKATDPSFKGEWSQQAQVILLNSNCSLFFPLRLKAPCEDSQCKNHPEDCTHRDVVKMEAGKQQTLSAKEKNRYYPNKWKIFPEATGSLSTSEPTGSNGVYEVTYTAPATSIVSSAQRVIVYAYDKSDTDGAACGYGIIEVVPQKSSALLASQGLFQRAFSTHREDFSPDFIPASPSL